MRESTRRGVIGISCWISGVMFGILVAVISVWKDVPQDQFPPGLMTFQLLLTTLSAFGMAIASVAAATAPKETKP